MIMLLARARGFSTCPPLQGGVGNHIGKHAQTSLKTVDFLALGFSTGTVLEVRNLTKPLILLAGIEIGAGEGNRTLP
jgi:hypothetical protein